MLNSRDTSLYYNQKNYFGGLSSGLDDHSANMWINSYSTHPQQCSCEKKRISKKILSQGHISGYGNESVSLKMIGNEKQTSGEEKEKPIQWSARLQSESISSQKKTIDQSVEEWGRKKRLYIDELSSRIFKGFGSSVNQTRSMTSKAYGNLLSSVTWRLTPCRNPRKESFWATC